jgi:hypothetical protein
MAGSQRWEGENNEFVGPRVFQPVNLTGSQNNLSVETFQTDLLGEKLQNCAFMIL